MDPKSNIVLRVFSLIVFVILVLPMFPTVAVADSLAINNVQIKNIGYTSATISWYTNSPATSQVNYGASSIDEYKSPESISYTNEHSITITNLRPNTRYQFQVNSKTETGLTDQSQILTFSTLAFSFDESVGNFTELNATPTPTPAAVANTNQYQTYAPNAYQSTQPIYMIPPIIYQQPASGQTLGAQTTVPTPTPFLINGSANSGTVELIKSGIWGGVVFLSVITIFFGVIMLQFFKNRNDLETLRIQLLTNQSQQVERTNDTQVKNSYRDIRDKQKKTYSFDVG